MQSSYLLTVFHCERGGDTDGEKTACLPHHVTCDPNLAPIEKGVATVEVTGLGRTLYGDHAAFYSYFAEPLFLLSKWSTVSAFVL